MRVLQWLLPALLLIYAATVVSREQVLPEVLLRTPEPVRPDAERLTGLIASPADLGTRPRAVLGYVSEKHWAIVEFLAMTHASWRHLMGSPRNRIKLDIFAFSHPRWTPQLSSICRVIDLDIDFSPSPHPECYFISYPPPPHDIWHGYPFINNVHFFADDRVARIMKSNYGYIMKSDFDTFLTPALLSHTPTRLTFGIQEYGLLPDTQKRLVHVAGQLGFRHKGDHNLGPTWLGDADTIITMANRTIPVLHHIITKEFEQLPQGGIAQNWAQGEGFPLWSAGMAAMYATELIANHFIDNYESTLLMDMHADSSLSIHEVLHIHCRHGDGDFSKFDFFKHHYDHVDLTKLDINIVKDYAMHLAVTTWRTINPQDERTGSMHEEL